jgi:hypothetical protein
MQGAQSQVDVLPLFGPVLSPSRDGIPDSGLTRPSVSVGRIDHVSLNSGGLLKARDFVLPAFVGYTEGGDLAVGGCVDQVQLEQVFRLAEADAQVRSEFCELCFAEQQLQKRRYWDWLKRQTKKGHAL